VDREYRNRAPWLTWPIVAIVVAVVLAWPVATWVRWSIAAVFVVVIVYLTVTMRRRVVLSEDGLAVSDWRGRTRLIPYAQTRELRLTRENGRPYDSRSALSVRAGDETVKFGQYFPKATELIDAIVNAAGLAHRGETWLTTKYYR
jgi:hypothetical protein